MGWPEVGAILSELKVQLMDAGSDINAGALVELKNGYVTQDTSCFCERGTRIGGRGNLKNDACVVNDTTILVAYIDSDTNKGKITVLDCSNDRVSPIIEAFPFFDSAVDMLKVAPLSANKVLITFATMAGTRVGYAVVAMWDGNNIILGDIVKVKDLYNSPHIVCDNIGIDRAVIAYTDTSLVGFLVAISVVGTVITLGTPVQRTMTGAKIHVCGMGVGRGVAEYNNSNISAVGFTVSGNIISLGAPVVVQTSSWSLLGAFRIDVDRVLICFNPGGICANSYDLSGATLTSVFTSYGSIANTSSLGNVIPSGLNNKNGWSVNIMGSSIGINNVTALNGAAPSYNTIATIPNVGPAIENTGVLVAIPNKPNCFVVIYNILDVALCAVYYEYDSTTVSLRRNPTKNPTGYAVTTAQTLTKTLSRPKVGYISF